jgi:hypothetical protein
VVGPQRTSFQGLHQVKKKQKYVKPEVTSIDSSEIVEALGPASAYNGISPGTSRDGQHHWSQSDVDPEYDG